MIDQETLQKWTDWSKRDDACNLFVPSDIRQMLGMIERQQRDHIGAHRISMDTVLHIEGLLAMSEADNERLRLENRGLRETNVCRQEEPKA